MLFRSAGLTLDLDGVSRDRQFRPPLDISEAGPGSRTPRATRPGPRCRTAASGKHQGRAPCMAGFRRSEPAGPPTSEPAQPDVAFTAARRRPPSHERGGPPGEPGDPRASTFRAASCGRSAPVRHGYAVAAETASRAVASGEQERSERAQVFQADGEREACCLQVTRWNQYTHPAGACGGQRATGRSRRVVNDREPCS